MERHLHGLPAKDITDIQGVLEETTNQLGIVSVTMSVHDRAFPGEPGQNENLNLIIFTRH